MGAFRIFSRFAELLDIKVTRAAAAWLRLNADGTVSERTASQTVDDLGATDAATAGTLVKRDANGNARFATVVAETNANVTASFSASGISGTHDTGGTQYWTLNRPVGSANLTLPTGTGTLALTSSATGVPDNVVGSATITSGTLNGVSIGASVAGNGKFSSLELPASSTLVAESALAATSANTKTNLRNALGLGTGDSPTFFSATLVNSFIAQGWSGQNAVTAGSYASISVSVVGALRFATGLNSNVPDSSCDLFLNRSETSTLLISSNKSTGAANLIVTGNLTASGTIKPGSFTAAYALATLTGAGRVGEEITCTECLTPAIGSAVVGAGTQITKCSHNGTTWIVTAILT